MAFATAPLPRHTPLTHRANRSPSTLPTPRRAVALAFPRATSPRATLAAAGPPKPPATDPCPQCSDRKTLPCSLCNAVGFLQVDEATAWRTCHICKANGKIPCPQCASPSDDQQQLNPASTDRSSTTASDPAR